MTTGRTPAPNRWAVYSGLNGMTEYVSLADIIGVKYPDGPNNYVTLRMSNGHFVATTESLSQVLSDIGALAAGN